MELELKHLAPYLPYGLKVYVFDDPEYLKKYLLKYPDGVWWVDITCENINEKIFFNGYKPLLRPLSDLTKEIEHNGERFIPKKLIKKLYPNANGWLFIDDDVFAGYHKDLSKTIIEWCVMAKFIEWHFDVFNLIENNLAININDIQP